MLKEVKYINKIKAFLYKQIIKIDIKFNLYYKLNEFKKLFDVKIGYRDKTGNIIKCRYCKSKNLDYYDNIICSNWCSTIEKRISCKDCGNDLGYKNN